MPAENSSAISCSPKVCQDSLLAYCGDIAASLKPFQLHASKHFGRGEKRRLHQMRQHFRFPRSKGKRELNVPKLVGASTVQYWAYVYIYTCQSICVFPLIFSAGELLYAIVWDGSMLNVSVIHWFYTGRLPHLWRWLLVWHFNTSLFSLDVVTFVASLWIMNYYCTLEWFSAISWCWQYL